MPLHSVRRIVRASLSSLYLILIVLTIPLAFDVGGLDCGLAFSLTAFLLYFVLTSIVLVTRRTRYFSWVAMVYYAQHIFIPSLLTYFLSIYSDLHPSLPRAWPVDAWRIALINSTSIITISEGFCSLLLIQAIGLSVNWLTVYKSDSWLIVSLVASGSIITTAAYFLYRIYVFPFLIGIASASLLGLLLTVTLIIGIFGIVSGKGSIIESSLLLAYIVHCIYEVFPVLSSNATETVTLLFRSVSQNLQREIPTLPSHLIPALPSHLIPTLPSHLISPLLHFVPFITFNVPSSFRTVWDFLILCLTKLTVPIILNLVYRLGVFYAATKIIPPLYHNTSKFSVSALSLNSSTPRLGPHSRPVSRTPSGTRLVDQTPDKNSVSLLDLTNASVSPLDQLKEPLPAGPAIPDPFPEQLRPQPVNRKKSFKLAAYKKPPSTIVSILYAYAPCIVIAVYTHLMLSYTGDLGTGLFLWASSSRIYTPVLFDGLLVHPWEFWNWVNMGTTLLLYTTELLGLGVR